MQRILQELPPAWFGYRYVKRVPLRAYVARAEARRRGATLRVVHEESIAVNPLPRNIVRRDALPATRGWWGYSFRDVPERSSAETFIASVNDGSVVSYCDPAKANDFYPAVLSGGRALELREVRFRPRHAEQLRSGLPAVRRDRATWVAERVYHNHSHWLTAHLPKLLLLRRLDALADALLPTNLTPVMESSLRLVGLDPGQFARFDPSRLLEVKRLTLIGTDRFRPELLQLVPEACGLQAAPRGSRRVFISRAAATRRRLINEDEIWPMLRAAGFERVEMERLGFDAQVSLMRETGVLLGPHGAGLTNMMFCPPGTHVIEIADLSFPNPNFYALACGTSHHYWLVPGEGRGDTHPLEKDLHVEPAALRDVLQELPR